MSGRYEFAPTQAFIDSFAPDDIRRDVIIGMAAGNPYANKYNDIVAGTDNAYVFRLAEMYLIRAEAETCWKAAGRTSAGHRCHQGKGRAGAHNHIRQQLSGISPGD
jgi:hypothetical protein